MRKLLTLTLTILLTAQTNITANEIILKMGDKSPYDGVLMPEKNYRFYQEQVRVAEQLELMAKEVPECETPKWPTWAVLFLSGALVGLAINASGSR